MMPTHHFGSYTSARQNLRAVLDAAEAGLVTTIDRDRQGFTVMRSDQLREVLAELRPASTEFVAEGGGWAVVIPGVPVHGDGPTFDEALDDAVVALREYAEDWQDHLRLAPNHSGHQAVVTIVELSDDSQLRQWLLGDTSADHRSLSA